MSKHVFISYSREDAEMMQKVETALRTNGIKTWTDTNLKPGTRQWKTAIEDALENSGAVVVILSPDAKKSEWVDRELEYARMRNITIMPLLVRGDALSAVPFELVSSQWIDLRTAWEAGIAKLVKTLKEVLPSTKSHYMQIHEAVVTLAEQMPEVLWMGLMSIDGLTVAFHSTSRSSNSPESDRVSAMSAATLSLSERIASELGLGMYRLEIIVGQQGTCFNLLLGDDYTLIFAVTGMPSFNAILDTLRSSLRPLLDLLNVDAAL